MVDAAALTEPTGIPDKLFFRIGEVSSLVGVEPYVLRFWETEFPALSPKKSGTGHRLYRRKDVELLLKIKHLLYERRFTIEGARQHLQSEARNPARKRPVPVRQRDLFSDEPLQLVKQELTDILGLLKE